jgi:mannose-1-phosphate guanylyltransferase
MRVTLVKRMKKIMQAFVLGAGLGTRLRPLTEGLPKPLVPIFQKPLITFALDHLIEAGIRRFFVNTHHQPERFVETFPDSSYRGRPIDFHYEPELLETAGGIANIAKSLSNEPLLVYNGDLLTDLPLAPLLNTHFAEGNVVTLALRFGPGPKHIAFDRGTGRVVDIRNQLGTGAAEEFVFSGVDVVDRQFIQRLVPGVKRSVIPAFLDLIRENEKLGGVVINDGHWWDVGNREAYLQLHRELLTLKFPAYFIDDPNWKTPVHNTAAVDQTAQIRGCSVVGAKCRVGAGATLEDTILWPGSQIASRSKLHGCIVRCAQKAEGTHLNQDI